MKVSVVIPAIPRRINRLKSVISRLMLNGVRHPEIDFETIIVDGSIEGEYKKLALYASNYMKVIYVSLPIGKFINAAYPRNVGLRLSRGEVLTQIDIDWWISEDFLEGLYEPYANGNKVLNRGFMIDTSKGANCVKNGFDYVEAVGEVLLSPDGASKQFLDICNKIGIDGPKPPSSVWLWAASREAFIDIGGYDEQYTRSYCYHPEVEVLSQTRGWIYIKDAIIGENILSHNPITETNEWNKVNNKFEFDYDGELCRFKSLQTDIAVTPNHNMWAKINGEYSKIQAQNINVPKNYRSTQQCYKFRLSCNPSGKIDVDETIKIGNDIYNKYLFTELCAYYVADGHYCIDNKYINIGKDPKVNPGPHARIQFILKNLQLNYTISNHTIIIKNENIHQWMGENCGIGSQQKCIPSYLFSSNGAYCKAFIEILMSCDGLPDGRYYTTSKKLVEDLAILSPMAGYWISDNKSKPQCNKWKECFIIKIKTEKTSCIREGNKIQEKYTGKVHCVEVNNGLLVVRSRGKTMICGNSREDDSLLWRLTAVLPTHYGSYKKFAGLHIWHSDFTAMQRNDPTNQFNKEYYSKRFISKDGSIVVKEIVCNQNWDWGKMLKNSYSIIDGITRDYSDTELWIAENVKDIKPYTAAPWDDTDHLVASLPKVD